MMIGARTAAWAKSGGVPTARDYVQDGLIAMWDGIENAGWGVHDPNATVWKDLSANGHDLAVDLTQAKWDGTHLSISGKTCIGESLSDIITLEIVFRDSSSSSYPNNKGSYFIVGEDKGVYAGWYSHLVGGCSLLVAISTNEIDISRTVRGNYSYVYSNLQYWHNSTSYKTYRPPVKALELNSITAEAKNGRTIEISSLRVYSRALTAGEIAANYAIDKARFDLP